MTKAELIKELDKFPDDCRVVVKSEWLSDIVVIRTIHVTDDCEQDYDEENNPNAICIYGD